MQTMLLGAAALAAFAVSAAPAGAQDFGGSGLSAAPDARSGHRGFDRDDRDDRHDRRDRRRHRGDRFTYFGDREYQGDTLWRSDGFNDWWHERPHRSYPAWVSRNRNCERMWWSGGDWRC